jgi:predicted nucleic-acid-binding protein
MRAVDTNVIVRLIVRDDPQQTAAAEHFVEKGAWVSNLALAETVWVLDSVYGLSPPNWRGWSKCSSATAIWSSRIPIR